MQFFNKTANSQEWEYKILSCSAEPDEPILNHLGESGWEIFQLVAGSYKNEGYDVPFWKIYARRPQ